MINLRKRILKIFQVLWIVATLSVVVSCGSSYVINQFDSSKSTIFQEEFDKRMEELRKGENNFFDITFVNSLNEKKVFKITKENMNIVEEQIKKFLNVFDTQQFIFNEKEKKILDEITSETIKENDGITETLSPGEITLSKMPSTQIKNILANIKIFFSKKLNLRGWNITLKRSGLDPFYRVDEEKGTLSYTIKATKTGYREKEYEVEYLNFFKWEDYRTQILESKIRDGLKSGIEQYLTMFFSGDDTPLNIKTYKQILELYINEVFLDSIKMHLKKVDDPSQPPELIDQKR